MKRKRLLLFLAIVLLALLAWFLWLREVSEHPPLPIPTASAPAVPAQELAARGAYLARAGNCMACHTDRGGAPYAGGRALATPFGTLYASNLTPDPRTGLGAWTADDFWQALHQGRSRDGRMLYPGFPYPNYTQVTRADADAIFAFLRTLAPVERENTPHALRWPYSTQAALGVWRALYFRPGVHRDEPAQSPQWNRGAYLVRGLGHCSACHSTRNVLGASDMMDLSGGMIPMQSWYAPSLASPAEAGVAHWEQQQVVELLRDGQAPNVGASALGPMAEVVLHSTQHLTQQDLEAMASFLRALPQMAPAMHAPAPVASAVAERGAALYQRHCVDCHGAQGQGVRGAYPPLAGNRAVLLHETSNLVQAVVFGGFAPATEGNPRPFGMPPFATLLSDADIAAVLTHIRTQWGNNAGAVSELAVAKQRGSQP